MKKTIQDEKTSNVEDGSNDPRKLEAAVLARLKQAFSDTPCLRDPGLMTVVCAQLTFLLPEKTLANRLDAPLALLQAIAPRTGTEVLLALQMVAVHSGALLYNHRAASASSDEADAYARRSSGLMRLFLEQNEALAKLQGKLGHQKVTVEHIHVQDTVQTANGSGVAAGLSGLKGSKSGSRANTQ
jgi:hypothetical protein